MQAPFLYAACHWKFTFVYLGWLLEFAPQNITAECRKQQVNILLLAANQVVTTASDGTGEQAN
jgi:hypothetical protein